MSGVAVHTAHQLKEVRHRFEELDVNRQCVKVLYIVTPTYAVPLLLNKSFNLWVLFHLILCAFFLLILSGFAPFFGWCIWRHLEKIQQSHIGHKCLLGGLDLFQICDIGVILEATRAPLIPEVVLLHFVYEVGVEVGGFVPVEKFYGALFLVDFVHLEDQAN